VPAKSEPPADASEREILLGWLDFHRTTLAEKCDGLPYQQLIEPSAPPSDLTLLGLVRHLTIMERVYLAHPLGVAPFDPLYCTDDQPDGDFAGLTPDHAGPSMEAWDAEKRLADDGLAGVESLDGVAPNINRAVRWLLVKLIQEYARHNGHADLIRERIDGATGE
jgi:hypothetical protein